MSGRCGTWPPVGSTAKEVRLSLCCEKTLFGLTFSRAAIEFAAPPAACAHSIAYGSGCGDYDTGKHLVAVDSLRPRLCDVGLGLLKSVAFSVMPTSICQCEQQSCNMDILSRQETLSETIADRLLQQHNTDSTETKSEPEVEATRLVAMMAIATSSHSTKYLIQHRGCC